MDTINTWTQGEFEDKKIIAALRKLERPGQLGSTPGWTGFAEEEDTSSIVFDFNGQWKLFKRFPPEDPFRSLIVTKFVNAIVTHPRANEFTGINMANTGCGNDFLITLSQRLLEDCSLLPNLEDQKLRNPGKVV